MKETQGIVKVFHYDGQGNESLVKNTGVAFSLISEEDQKMFQKGIVVETDEELESLLENLES